MNLKELWGNKVWENATTEQVITYKLSEADGGQVEEMSEQIRMLRDMLARFMEESKLTDQQKLYIIGIYGWELVE